MDKLTSQKYITRQLTFKHENLWGERFITLRFPEVVGLFVHGTLSLSDSPLLGQLKFMVSA